MAAIELVVTDLDGTLWGAGERIHDRTLAALHELQDRAVPLLVATGRRPRSAATALARNHLTPPAVLLDGAIGRELPDGRVFHETCFQPEDAQAVLAAFLAAQLSPCVYVDRPGVDVVVGDRPSTSPAHLEVIGRFLARAELERVVERERVYGFGIAGGDPAILRPVLDGIGVRAGASITRDVLFGGATLMVRPRGTSKWDGVLSFCADQGIHPGHVLAVGDGENDLELLGGARIACVVADGCAGALALADHVIEPACDGGWSMILKLL